MVCPSQGLERAISIYHEDFVRLLQGRASDLKFLMVTDDLPLNEKG